MRETKEQITTAAVISHHCHMVVRLLVIIAMMLTPLSGRTQREFHTWRKPEMDIPISLAAGSTYTATFQLKKKGEYAVIVQVAKRISFDELCCKLGIAIDYPRDHTYRCAGEPLLQAEWAVRGEDDEIVAHGDKLLTKSTSIFLNDYILKYVAYFKGQSKKTYTLEIKFTKNGIPLNVCDPHLIVMRIGYDYMSM